MKLNHLTRSFNLPMNFTTVLNTWYSKNKRLLPWRNNPTPYPVWLSEIILQQTRISQGLPYYNRFIKSFPTVKKLAEAREEEILKLWQGLGYYSRARNLHAAAIQVVGEFDGDFPSSYRELLKLKGVGPYSAAAIASICYDEPVAVVDGNVYRFLSRHFAISTPIDSSEGKKEFQALADSLLDKKQPGNFNQAMMEFGAMICTPNNPQCHVCVFQNSCAAYQLNRVSEFPVKEKVLRKEMLHLNYFVIRLNEGIFLQQRPTNGIWGNMYEFPVMSSKKSPDRSQLQKAANASGLPSLKLAESSEPLTHLLTHRKIIARFWLFDLHEFTPAEHLVYVANAFQLQKYAVPKPIERYLSERIFTETK